MINPLRMRATRADGGVVEALAINEVSMLRAGPQAAKLRILVDGRERMAELVADGALLATPAGSTAYNYSAHGPILPIGADMLALTPMAAFRPRRWRGALLPKAAQVSFEVLDADKRPVSAVADSTEVRDAVRIEVASVPDIVAPHPVRPGPRARGAADPRAVRVSACGGSGGSPAEAAGGPRGATAPARSARSAARVRPPAIGGGAGRRGAILHRGV